MKLYRLRVTTKYKQDERGKQVTITLDDFSKEPFSRQKYTDERRKRMGYSNVLSVKLSESEVSFAEALETMNVDTLLELCDCGGDDSARGFLAELKNLCSGEAELEDYEPESDRRGVYELFPDENGIFHLHKPEYDVTIFCESEEEQKEAIESLTEMARVKKETALTEAEKIICRQYLEDLDKFGTCNEYKLLMKLIDGVALKEAEGDE
jgi:hypothetical protein